MLPYRQKKFVFDVIEGKYMKQFALISMLAIATTAMMGCVSVEATGSTKVGIGSHGVQTGAGVKANVQPGQVGINISGSASAGR